jgi:hypothetical protein
VAALQTDARGIVWVRLDGGGRQQVEVLATAGGLAIVDGVAVGQRLLLGVPDDDADG